MRPSKLRRSIYGEGPKCEFKKCPHTNMGEVGFCSACGESPTDAQSLSIRTSGIGNIQWESRIPLASWVLITITLISVSVAGFLLVQAW